MRPGTLSSAQHSARRSKQQWHLWSQVEALHCIALVRRRDVPSLRALRPAHLPLLRSILGRGSIALKKRFGVDLQELRVYLHYLPSYFHLHVHFVHTKHDASFGFAAGKAHALQDVIANIELMGDFYEHATLAVAVGEHDKLLPKLLGAQQAELEGFAETDRAGS